MARAQGDGRARFRLTPAAGDFFLGQNILLVVALLYLALFLAVAVHEVGHALAALAVSLPVRFVRIGSGPLLASVRIGAISIEIRLRPFFGLVSLYPAGISRRFATMVFGFGGVLGNMACMVLLAWLDRLEMLPDFGKGWASLTILVQGFFAIGNLLPFTRRRLGLPSDGLLLLRLLGKPARAATAAGLAYSARLARYSGNPDQTPSSSAASARIFYQLGRSDGVTDEDLRREVMEALERELARGGLPRAEELLVLDALIAACLLLEEPTLDPRLDQWSSRAFVLGSDLETIRGSRGAAHVLLGRNEEGRALLAPLAAGAAAPFDAFISQIFLARAEFRLGEVETAQRLLGSAHEKAMAWRVPADIEVLLARAYTEIGDAPASMRAG